MNHKIGIPSITNMKPLEEGEEIVVLKTTPAQDLPPQQGQEPWPRIFQPEAKRHKGTSHGQKGKGKGKGKDKGKGKGKGKFTE